MAGTDGRGRSKTRGSRQDKGRRDRSGTPLKSPSKKKKSKEPYSHIALQLIPSAALAPALSVSPKKVLKSRSPSPVAQAIACISRVGRAVIGEVSLSPTLKTPSQEQLDVQRSMVATEEAEDDEDDDYEMVRRREDGADFSDYESYRRELPVPEVVEEEFQELHDDSLHSELPEAVYASVKKNKQHPYKYELKPDAGDSDDSITVVSDMEYAHPNVKDTAEVIPNDLSDWEEDNLSEGEAEPTSNNVYNTTGEVSSPVRRLQFDDFGDRVDGIGDSLPPLASSRSTHSVDQGSSKTPREAAYSRNSIGDVNEDTERKAALQRLEELGFDKASKEFGFEEPTPQRNFLNPSEFERELFADTPVGTYPSLSAQNTSLDKSFTLASAQEIPMQTLEPVREETIPEERVVAQKSVNDLPMPDARVSQVPDVGESQVKAEEHSRLEDIVKKQEEMINRLSSELAKQENMHTALSQKQMEILQLSEKLKSEEAKTRLESPVTSPRKDTQRQSTGQVQSPGRTKPEARDSQRIRSPSASSEKNTPRHSAKQGDKSGQLEEKTIRKKERDRERESLRLELDNERKKFAMQQKVIKEQQQQLVENQTKIREIQQSPSYQHFASSPVTPRASSRNDQSAINQNFLLESRLKRMEDERNALLQLNNSLQEDNKALKALSVVYHEGGGPGGIAIKKHKEEISKENNELKAIVHRLNIELSRYQANYRAPTKEEILDLSFQPDGPVPPWLINIKYLSPLILAYDDKLKERNELIKHFEEQLMSLKARTQEIIRENHELHLAMEGKSETEGVALDEWVHLQEQAKLVVEENGLLMRQLDLKDKRAEEVEKEHREEVSKLMKQFRLTEQERREAETGLSDLLLKHEKLQKKQERLQSELNKRMTQDRHKNVMEQLQAEYQAEYEKLSKERENLVGRVEAVTKECRQLAVKLTDESTSKQRVQSDLSTANKTIRHLEKKLMSMQDKVEQSRERETVAGETLREVLAVAEKTALERDKYLEIIEANQLSTESAKKQMKENELMIRQLRHQIKDYKNKAEKNESLASHRLNSHERELGRIREKYESELNSLRSLIREKQKLLELAQVDKSRLEEQLDGVVETVRAGNNMMSPRAL